MVITIGYYILTKEICDKKELVGLNNCKNNSCQIKITLNYEDMKILDQNPSILYKKNKYKIKDIVYEEPYLNNGIPVNDITIITDNITNNKIIDFKIIYNNERIIKKIKNLIERN